MDMIIVDDTAPLNKNFILCNEVISTYVRAGFIFRTVGFLSMEHGAWSIEHGAWSMEHGGFKHFTSSLHHFIIILVTVNGTVILEGF